MGPSRSHLWHLVRYHFCFWLLGGSSQYCGFIIVIEQGTRIIVDSSLSNFQQRLKRHSRPRGSFHSQVIIQNSEYHLTIKLCFYLHVPLSLLSTRNRDSGCVIVRCSQPEVGWLYWRCEDDEHFLQTLGSVVDTSKNSSEQSVNGVEALSNGTDCQENVNGIASRSAVMNENSGNQNRLNFSIILRDIHEQKVQNNSM